MIAMADQIARFAALVRFERAAEYRRQYGTDHPDLCAAYAQVDVRPGKRWIKVDCGGSGKYMVDTDGSIYGIKAYGVPHPGHVYGRLDTTGRYDWGGYCPSARLTPRQITEDAIRVSAKRADELEAAGEPRCVKQLL